MIPIPLAFPHSTPRVPTTPPPTVRNLIPFSLKPPSPPPLFLTHNSISHSQTLYSLSQTNLTFSLCLDLNFTMGGLSIITSPTDEMSPPHLRAHRAFLLSNYLLLGCASGCAFLTLSLRLIPSLYGFLLIFLHALTIGISISSCSTVASKSPTGSWYGAHMVVTVIAAILQGSVAILAFSRTDDFLNDGLKSYVRQEDGVVILRMIGGLGVSIFCLEWMSLALAFVLRYYAYVDNGSDASRRSARVAQVDESVGGNWPWMVKV
ncbi:hypothetical protein LUZ60_004415 [Juncus effusus]|nr:hypothetical protein LUZ60_004415 [Juncus effusus]